jgi:hypothetical protein
MYYKWYLICLNGYETVRFHAGITGLNKVEVTRLKGNMMVKILFNYK